MTPWPHHQMSHWFGVHCHTTATSCYPRREKVAVDAAIERSQGCVLDSVGLSSLVNLLWWSLTTLCRQACGGRTNARG